MHHSLKTAFAALAIVLICQPGYAQDAPKMPPQLTALVRLLGKWEGPAKLTLEGKTYQFTYYADFKSTADSSGLYMEEWFTAPDLGTLKGSNLLGYNVNDQKIHWFSVDNLGTTHDHIGSWKSADHFFMQAVEMQGKKKFVEKIDISLKQHDILELNLVATVDGKETERAMATFHRVH